MRRYGYAQLPMLCELIVRYVIFEVREGLRLSGFPMVFWAIYVLLQCL